MKEQNGFITTAEVNSAREVRFRSIIRAIRYLVKSIKDDPTVEIEMDEIVHIWAKKVIAGEIEIDDITREMLNLASLGE